MYIGSKKIHSFHTVQLESITQLVFKMAIGLMDGHFTVKISTRDSIANNEIWIKK